MALTVPLLVAVKAGFTPVLRLRPPVKLIVVFVLLLRKTPWPVPLLEVIAPPNAIVPAVLL